MARTKYFNKKTGKWEYADSAYGSGSTVTDSSRNVNNVRNFGAAGDGVTDDTAAIASAIDKLPVGGTLYFPAGTYMVDNINLKSDMTVLGDGWGSVIKLLPNRTNYNGLNNCLTIKNAERVNVRDIKLDGNRATQRSTAETQDQRLNGIFITSAKDVLVENVWMDNNGYHGTIMVDVSNVIFSRCHSTNNGYRPFHGHTQIYDCIVTNCLCENNGLGLPGSGGSGFDSIFFFGVQRLTINNNIVRSNRRGCITVQSDNSTVTEEDKIIPSRNITISGNVCECYEDLEYVPESGEEKAKFSSKGIVVYGGSKVLENVAITGNTINNAHEAIELYSTDETTCSLKANISGNVIIDCSYGVIASRVEDVVIANNQFNGLSHFWIEGIGICNSLIQGNNVRSLDIEGSMCDMYDCVNTVIRDNNLQGACANAIRVNADSTKIIVLNNTLYGFTGDNPVTNTNGRTDGNIIIALNTGSVEMVKLSPYTNNGFVRASLVNPNTTTDLVKHTTPVEITDSDTMYELNTFVSISNEYEDPSQYDYSSEYKGIVFLTGTDLSTAVGIVTLANDIGTVEFSDGCISNAMNLWGVKITISAEKVKELYPTATHVMMQTDKAYTDPDTLSAGYHNLNDGHAYVYRKQ